MKALRCLTWLLCILTWSPLALARAEELVVSLALSSDLLPTRVCIRTTKLGNDLSEHRIASLEDLAPGQTRFIGASSPACASAPSVCNKCSNPSLSSGGVVCWLAEGENPKEPQRDLQLQLDGAGISALEVSGTDILLKADVADGQPPRIRSLGGAYYPSFAQAISGAGTLAIGLRNRCVERFLSFSTDPPGTETDETATYTTTLQPVPAAYDRRAPATLAVPEEGAVNRVELQRGSAVYSGTFTYPSNGPVELLATKFSFTWRKSRFVLDRRPANGDWRRLGEPAPRNEQEKKARLDDATARECPRAWLVRPGRECQLAKKAAGDECEYACSDLPPIEFPTRVRFELKPPRSAKTKDLVKWEEDLRFPNASFTSIPPGEERRIYLIWPNEQTEPGREWDALELTGPDGKTHQIEWQTTSLLVNSLQSPATFGYRYLGRGPYRSGTLRADGDLLIVPPPSTTRQAVVLGALLHAGPLYRHGLSARQWSPALDANLVALYRTHLEVTASGMFTYQPSELQVHGAPARWSSSPQMRLMLGVGWRGRVWQGCYWAIGLRSGVATRAFESDWSRSKPWFTNALRARFGYEVSRALAFELFGTIWYPERYVVRPQDAAGPLSPELRTTYSVSAGAGLQWADVF